MILRRSSRVLAIALLALAVAIPALPAHAAGVPTVKSAAPTVSTKRVATRPYCGPTLDQICRVACVKVCQVATPATRRADTAAPAASPGRSTTRAVYCGPFLDKICHVVCPRCLADAATPAGQRNSSTLAGARMMCAPDFQIVCFVIGQTLCRKYQCGLASPSRQSGMAAASLWACAPWLQQVCGVAALVLCRTHGCYASPGSRLRLPLAFKQ